MPDAQGRPLAGEPGYQAPAPANPSQSVPGLINATPGINTVTPGTPTTSYTPATATPTQANATSYDPHAFAVTSDQTVQGQLKGLIDEDSPLMQQAATRAKQEQNARGTANSTMAMQAGHQAVIASALPIAQQDATAFNNAATRTTDAQNAALNFGAAAQNQTSQANAQLGTNVSLANAQAVNQAFTTAVNNATQLTNTRLNNETQVALQGLDAQSKMALAQLDANNRQLLQQSQGASNAYVQAVTNIANISTSNVLSKEAKDAATASQLNMLNEQLRALGAVGGLDLSQYFVDLNGVNAVADEGIARVQAAANQQFGGHWETPPPSTDENGNVTQPPDVWVRN